MPYSTLHQKQKRKNYATLFLLLSLVVIFFAASMVRL